MSGSAKPVPCREAACIRAHIPTIDLIDFDYIYWHTAEDTLEHISSESLQKVGAVTLHYLRQTLTK